MDLVYISPDAVVDYLESSASDGLEQWIECKDLNGFRVICWIRIVQERVRAPGKWTVYYKQSLDHAIDGFFNVDEFQDVGDPDSPEGQRHVYDSGEAAINHAVSLGAKLDHFVKVGSMHIIYERFTASNPKPGKGIREWFVR